MKCVSATADTQASIVSMPTTLEHEPLLVAQPTCEMHASHDVTESSPAVLNVPTAHATAVPALSM
jgi:hypothetical protein